jgi:hypothetical protein
MDCFIKQVSTNGFIAKYQLQTQSLYFPDFDLQSAIARCVEIAYQRNTSAAIRDLKQQLLRTTQTELPHHPE